MIFFTLANILHLEKIINLFEKNLDKKNKAITEREFFCPLGTKAAIKRKQVIIGINNNKIISAVRFYPRKKDGIVSVYQFAINKKHRGKNILYKMLKTTNYTKFEFSCPETHDFNLYYKKIGGKIINNKNNLNYYILIIPQN